jgi:hypothetical protein
LAAATSKSVRQDSGQLGVKAAWIRVLRGPKEAVGQRVPDGRLDVPKVPARQLDLLPTELMATLSMGSFPPASRRLAVHPKHAFVTSSADSDDAHRGKLRSFIFHRAG